MISVTYFAGFLLLTLLSSRFDNKLMVLIASTYLIAGSGLRTSGWDWDNWMNSIYFARTLDVELETLFLLKDPVWYFIAKQSALFSDSYRLPILIICSLSVVTKLHAISKSNINRGLYISLYGLLLSPELEFSGMRSALASSFILAAATSQNVKSKFGYMLLSVTSHISAIVVALSLIDHKSEIHYKRFILGVVIIAIFGRTLIEFGSEFGRFDAYSTDVARAGSFIYPVVCVGLLLLQIRSILRYEVPNTSYVINILICLYAFSLAMAGNIAALSHRVLELGNPLQLYLYVACNQAYRGPDFRRINLVGLLLFSALLLGRHFHGGSYSVVEW
jgi:hypothetical protein